MQAMLEEEQGAPQITDADNEDEHEAAKEECACDVLNDMFDLMEAEEKEAEASAHQREGNGDHVVEACELELERYKKEQRLTSRKKTPLQWWKENHLRFPILALLARKYLAVQPTSASSERVFSKALRLLSAKRSRMDPAFAGKAFFVSENWDWFEKQVDIAKKLEEINSL